MQGIWVLENSKEKKLMNNSLIDSNILIYIADKRELLKHEKANRWIEKQKARLHKICILPQNFREFTSITLKKKIAESSEIDEWIEVFEKTFTLLDEQIEDIRIANSLCKDFNTGFWDSLIASAMKRHGITIIYTEDVKDFAKFPGIKAVNPLKK